jgi:act minimal PKS acyl carrier protein
MTFDDLRDVLSDCAGESEQGPLTADQIDLAFEELGYDSLALLETAARIDSRYGVKITDEQILELRTLRELLEVVNGVAEAA